MLMTMEASSRAVIGVKTGYYRQERALWKGKDQIFFRVQWKCVSKAGTGTKSPVSRSCAFLRSVAIRLGTGLCSSNKQFN